jgi:lipoprotein NlpI
LNQNDAALRDLDRAALREPANWRTHFLRAVTNQKLNRFGDALQDLDRAIGLKAEEPELVRRRAYLRVVTGNFDGALADYEHFIRIMPNSGIGPFGRGVSLYLAGDFGAAAVEFDRQLRDAPRDGGIALWLVKASLRNRAPLAWEQFAGSSGPQPEWMMIRELLGDGSLDSVTREMSRLRAPEDGRRTVGACEHALFLGTWASLKGDDANARASLDSAVAACPPDSIERTEARTELARVQRTYN